MEYLLLAVVIIIIGKVIVSPMGEKLQEWATKMLGPNGYYACLMEYGLIPGKKWESLGIECGAYKVAAVGDLESIGEGSEFASGVGSGSGSGGDSSSGGDDSSEEGGDSSSSDDKGSDSNDDKRKKRKPSSGTGDGSGDSFSEGSDGEGSRANEARFPTLKSGNKNRGSSSPARRKAKRKRPKTGEMKDVKLKADQDSSDASGEEEWNEGYLGRMIIEDEDEEREKPPPIFQAQAAGAKTGGESSASQKKKDRLQVKRPEGGESGEIGDVKPLTFGAYMKWLFIAVFLIAVILVIGSQILEFQNADT